MLSLAFEGCGRTFYTLCILWGVNHIISLISCFCSCFSKAVSCEDLTSEMTSIFDCFGVLFHDSLNSATLTGRIKQWLLIYYCGCSVCHSIENSEEPSSLQFILESVLF
jgi:hypothetical protein